MSADCMSITSELQARLSGSTHVDQVCLVPHMQIVHDRRLVEMSELGHVISFIEFSRVDLVNVFHVDFTALKTGRSGSEDIHPSYGSEECIHYRLHIAPIALHCLSPQLLRP